MTAIRKVVITEFGGPEVIKIVDSTCLSPPAGHVQIATEYAGFTGGDTLMRQGVYPDQEKAPLTPGYCLVGTVREVGEDCSGELRPGDVVAVLTKYDADAELVNQPEKYCIKMPDGLDRQQATALLCDWNTAYAMARHTAGVSRGQRVFVHGLSGAVGCGLMALCCLWGAEVYGTASERNHDLIRSYGAVPFVYTDKRWMDAMKELGGAHAVFDPLGFESFDESYSILATEGILVGYGFNKDVLEGGRPPWSTEAPLQKLLERSSISNAGKRATFFGLTRDSPTYTADIKALMDMVQKGVVKVPIKKIWPMEDVQAAHREWGGVPGIGSLLIKVSGI